MAYLCKLFPRSLHKPYDETEHFKRQAYVQVGVKSTKTRLSLLINFHLRNKLLFGLGSY